MPARKYLLDQRAHDLLRREYDSRTETIDRLARLLGVPRHTVKHWAQELGLARTKEGPWTPEEVAYLEAHLHRRHVRTIARRLGRTVTAVSLKAKRLGLRKTAEGYTLQTLALALGVDAHKVAAWVQQGLLKASPRHTDRERDPHYISEAAVRRFLVQHALEVDLRRADPVWLIDLLAHGGRP